MSAPSSTPAATQPLSPDEAERGAVMLLELGQELRAQQKLTAAYQVLRRAVELNPNLGSALLYLSVVCQDMNNHGEAIRHAALAAKVAPTDSSVLLHLTQTLISGRRYEEAHRLLQQLSSLPKTRDWAVAEQALLYLRQEKTDKAFERLQQHLASSSLTKGNVAAIFGQICLRLQRSMDAVEHLQAGIRGEPEGSDARPLLEHILGDCYRAAGEHAKAFAAYARANDARQSSYDPAQHQRTVHELCQAAWPPRDLKLPSDIHPGAKLVFVVGMPRTGLQLLERVLSQHPQVSACGERLALPSIEQLLAQRMNIERREYGVLPASLTKALRNAYEQPLESLGNARWYIDRAPDHDLRLPLIARLFPSARVLYCERDPLDTCFSCYAHNFNEQHSFTTRLPWIAERHIDHHRLMAAWWPALPLTKQRVRYEDLVSEPEPTIRKLLTFLDIPFDEACLRPHPENPMQTGDEPLTTAHVGCSQPFADELASLRERLDQAGLLDHGARDPAVV